MADGIRQRDRAVSLAAQVIHAERQVLDRHRLVGLRVSLLGQAIHRRMTSPRMLLWACGLGFTAGQFQRGADDKIFDSVSKLMAFSRTIARLFPSTESGTPHQ